MHSFYAHSLPDTLPEQWERLETHLQEVASLAAEFASRFNAQDWGNLAGLWHDLGKYSPAFQGYLHTANGLDDPHEQDVAGRVDHSTFGAQVANKHKPFGPLLAYCIAGHHAGLPDNVGDRAGLSARLEKPFNIQPPAWLLEQPAPGLPKFAPSGSRRRDCFTIGFFTRIVFSCLVDADFLCTERFMSPDRALQRPQSNLPPAELQRRLDAFLANKQATADPTPVNACRQQVLSACRERADLPPGFFSLNVPTGGGKTLSSLAFALKHAAKHGLQRVIYAIPFTSIIEQTADVFRAALAGPEAERADDVVLEHHSNLATDDPARQSKRSRLAAENFDASLIVTTNVQLFESLFAARTSRCRKLHRLARSVIILDEAQTLPTNLLEPTLAALSELVRNYAATVVLCTATQPAVEHRDDFAIGLTGIRPIIDDAAALHTRLRRVEVVTSGPLDDAQLAAQLSAERRVLCIVNTRRHAADLYRLLAGSGKECFHLSASMCAAHRTDVVKQIRARLDPTKNKSCRVVSTAVIEAGVDVDFPAVYRASAGLDSIAQAAGRCNREGRLVGDDGHPRPGKVTVFAYDEQAHRPPPFTRHAAGHFREVEPDHRDDLLAPSAIEHYFRVHYWSKGGDHGKGWDQGKEHKSVMECFGGNGSAPSHHQFREAADAYQLIDDAQTSVLVPYGANGRNLIRQLQAMTEPPGREFLRASQRYVVGVRERDLKLLMSNQVLLERHGVFYLANDAAYDLKLGLNFNAVGLNIEMLIP